MKILVSSAKVSDRDSFLAYVIPLRFLVWLIFIKSISTARIKMYGETKSPWGTPCRRRIFLVSSPPQEDVCLSVAEEEADSPSDKLTNVEHFQAVVNVLVGHTIEGFLEVYKEN